SKGEADPKGTHFNGAPLVGEASARRMSGASVRLFVARSMRRPLSTSLRGRSLTDTLRLRRTGTNGQAADGALLRPLAPMEPNHRRYVHEYWRGWRDSAPAASSRFHCRLLELAGIERRGVCEHGLQAHGRRTEVTRSGTTGPTLG